MRCKKHFSVDVTSSVGVCASCLRERLCSFINAESNWPQYAIEDCRIPEPKPLPHPSPAPTIFPRSLSPYTARRNADRSVAGDDYLPTRNLQQMRFFSTPQVDLTSTQKNKKSKFQAISNLFRSRSAKSAHPSSDSVYPSAIRRKRSPLRLFSLNEGSIFRGQVDESDSDAESLSSVRFGCSPEPWKKTPSSTRTSHARAKASPARSGIGVCLSPLMRPSPMRHSGGAVEVVHSGEIRSTVRPHISTAGALSSNRSRKLADFTKFNLKR